MADTTSSASAEPLATPQGKSKPEVLPHPSVAPKKAAKSKWLKALLIVLGIMMVAGVGGWYWWQQQLNALPQGIAMANGRLESEQVEIATKYAGRIAVVLAREGQMVDTGEVVARMDTVELEAQLRSAQASVVRSEHEKTQAEALIVQRESERTFAQQELDRAMTLVDKGWMPREKLDQRHNEMKVAIAAYNTSVAHLEAAKASIVAGQAEVARLQAQINDSTLVAPRRGRIQYKLAQPGEVLSAGGRVLTLLDLADVYLTIFVPAHVAGPLSVGDEARVTLDPVPGYVFPAKVTFVATEAQFTPKMVETPEEREKLMFRVKLSIDPELRKKYENQVKTGIRGVGYVRSNLLTPWPERLAVKLP